MTIDGVNIAHVKKFSRLVQELNDLLNDIHEYCPEAGFVLLDTAGLGIYGRTSCDEEHDYKYIAEEWLDCASVNDVGAEQLERAAEIDSELHYRKKTKSSSKENSLEDLLRARYREYANHWNSKQHNEGEKPLSFEELKHLYGY